MVALALLVAGGLRARRTTPQVGAAPLPSSAALRVLTLGHDGVAASLAWILVSQRFLSTEPEGQVTWLREATATCDSLDPTWTLPSFYGALMASSRGDPVTHEQILVDAAARHPDRAWFPYALGISRLLNHDDPLGAARWLEAAAARPDATSLHRGAARALGGTR